MGGTLYLVPNLLGAVPPADVLPARTLAVARALRHWVVETPKAARAFIKSLDAGTLLRALDVQPLPERPTTAELEALLAPARSGAELGLLSDAGCPGVADPGAALVAAAHGAGLRVVPLVGPSAVLLALMASGMNGQSFAFHGYLPVRDDARAGAIRRLEEDSRVHARTQLVIETPYRNAALLAALATSLAASTVVCLAVDLTLPSETIERRTAGEWRGRDLRRFDRRPAMFVIEAARPAR
jgi:16S rRNA (cytidine1402-2'-O)-methyltransferase